MRWLIPLIGIVYCGVLAGHGQAAPRIASLNLCTDQLALMLADKEEIVALSPLVRDCSASVLCHEGLPHVIFAADVENILSVHPDIVLAGQYTARTAVMAAREVGAHIVILPPARRLSDIPGQIRRVAQAVGHPERGEALIAAFEKRLRGMSDLTTDVNPIAAVYEANGLVAGGASLQNDVLKYSGFQNLAVRAALPAGGRIPLETLLAWRPDLLILDRSGQGHSLAQAMLDNPVLTEFFPGVHHVNVPASLWLCGLPQTLEALAVLRRARAALAENKTEAP